MLLATHTLISRTRIEDADSKSEHLSVKLPINCGRTGSIVPVWGYMERLWKPEYLLSLARQSGRDGRAKGTWKLVNPGVSARKRGIIGLIRGEEAGGQGGVRPPLQCRFDIWAASGRSSIGLVDV